MSLEKHVAECVVSASYCIELHASLIAPPILSYFLLQIVDWTQCISSHCLCTRKTACFSDLKSNLLNSEKKMQLDKKKSWTNCHICVFLFFLFLFHVTVVCAVHRLCLPLGLGRPVTCFLC